MESSCVCGLHVNPCSVWDPSTLCYHCKQTTKLSPMSHNMSPIDLLSNSFSFC